VHPDARLWRGGDSHAGGRGHGRRDQAGARGGAEIPGSFTALQFQNQANPQFHHDTTAVEIWEQMEGRVDGFVAGVGTGGTFSGVARFLKERNPAVVNVAVETEGSILQGGAPGKHKVEGIGVHFVPETFHRDVCDRVAMVTDVDALGW
jgi:cysteine synthase